jgi:hypothetical protein
MSSNKKRDMEASDDDDEYMMRITKMKVGCMMTY